jgi:formylglycine-generating enzyme required for sulfatase activity
MFARRLAILVLSNLLFPQTAKAITIETVPVNNAGNANDPNTGNLYGGVEYNYRIGKYDVTVGQYTAFLNAVAATDTYGLYNSSMATDLNIAGIARSGASGNYSYSVIGSLNHPITYVSWGDAARFANWLNNGQPVGGEEPRTNETGAYTLNGAISDAALNAIVRNVDAKWFIPSESEWYKAAYYDPAAGSYWEYATGADLRPLSARPGNSPYTANFYWFSDRTIINFTYAVTRSTDYSSTQNYLTDVGAYTASASPYGTFDQSGNVFQWNEALIGGSSRGVRGGSWSSRTTLGSNSRLSIIPPTNEGSTSGFRVATVPEPSTAALAVVACGVICRLRKRFNA